MNTKLVASHGLIILSALFAGSSFADQGEDVAAALNRLYNDTRADCGGPSKPAFLCSGVVFRATVPSPAYQFYSVSPKSQASGGISASYLRKDAKFSKLAYGLNSGFVLYPIFENPKQNKDYQVLCSFPIDAATDDRSLAGCADSNRTAGKVEDFCQNLGINTADQWLADYNKNGKNHSAQCAFDVRDERNNGSASAFYQSIQAMNKLGAESLAEQNELRIAKWEEKPPTSPPVMSVFYSNAAGVEGARLDQIQWYKATGQYIPAVNLQLPQSKADDAKFSYEAGKQAIYPVTAKNSCDKYVESAKWVERADPGFKKNIYSLQITPTPCGRKIGEDQTNNFFNELVADHYLDPQWKDDPDNKDTNITSMRRQLICHFVIARNKAVYNIEPSRPYTPMDNSVNKGCNNVTP